VLAEELAHSVVACRGGLVENGIVSTGVNTGNPLVLEIGLDPDKLAPFG
jgi:hypothetical protein